MAGLPPRDDPDFAEEIVQRLALARMLLPISPSAERSLTGFNEAASSDVQTGRTSQESVDLALSVLRKVKLPVSLQRSLRASRSATGEAHAAMIDESVFVG